MVSWYTLTVILITASQMLKGSKVGGAMDEVYVRYTLGGLIFKRNESSKDAVAKES